MSAVAFASAQPTFTDRLQLLLERADFRRADSEDVREAIYRLRYDAYVAEGAIKPRFDKLFTDHEDEFGNAWIFGVYLDGELVSSIRLHVATKDYPEMPSLEVFPEVLQRALDDGKTVIDPTRFVISRDASRKYPQLRYVTTRLAWLACAYFDADLLLASVRAEHRAFYSRVFGHETVCAPRPYPMLEKPICLMVSDYMAVRDEVQHRYPILRSSVFERRMLFERLQEGAVTAPEHAPLQPVAEPEAV